jgi:hypothetical protein
MDRFMTPNYDWANLPKSLEDFVYAVSLRKRAQESSIHSGRIILPPGNQMRFWRDPVKRAEVLAGKSSRPGAGSVERNAQPTALPTNGDLILILILAL